jgi:poly-gamma-glutamate synthesis protein (capsule biosynthesis protein)
VGDIALGDHPKSVGFGFYSRYKEGIPLCRAESLFPNGSKADVIFGNLEFNLGNKKLPSGDFNQLNCRGISQYADFLEQAGFNVLNMANNHIFQHGREEFDKTLNLLSCKGISIAGLQNDSQRRNIVKVNDCSITFLAWSVRPRQGFSCTPPYKEFDVVDSFKEIEEAKSYSDLICVSLHWGEEFVEIPNDEEKLIARALIDRGANIVVGHHPHVIREVEEYNGGLIAYSLGNFICDMIWNKTTAKTGVLFAEFKNRNLVEWKWFPAIIGKDYFPKYCKPDSENSIDCNSAKFIALKEKNELSSYNEMALKALKQHRRLTLLHMIKNLHRYDKKILSEIALNAIKLRLPFNFCKVNR